MSKKILIDSDLLKDLLEGDFLPVKVWHERRKEGRKLLEESKEKHFSVVEWHPVSDKPSEEKPILVKYKVNNKTYYLYDHFEINSFFKSDSAKEWAYLPE